MIFDHIHNIYFKYFSCATAMLYFSGQDTGGLIVSVETYFPYYFDCILILASRRQALG